MERHPAGPHWRIQRRIRNLRRSAPILSDFDVELPTPPQLPKASNLLTSFGMPVTLTIDKERRLIITTGCGVVTDIEFIEARQQLLLNPDFDPCFDRIWNFHAVTESQVSEEIAAQLTAESPVAGKSICRAVIMSERSAPMKAILDFISCTRRANRRIAAFPDLSSAEQWVFTARHDLPPE